MSMLVEGFGLLAASGARGAFCTALAVLVALAVDRLCGEPPARWHPVVWMGQALDATGKRMAPVRDGGRNLKLFSAGALCWIALAAMVLIAATAAQAILARAGGPHLAEPFAGGLPGLLREAGVGIALGVLLKPLLALAMLRSEVRAVEEALGESLGAGRARLAWLVSRDVSALDAGEVRQSAAESLAENLNDSVVAPLFWFALLGLPGAALYRFANTADAMWGYTGMHDGRHWQWAGKWAARADDVLSWVPARLTALLLAAAAGGVPLARLAREARHTPSPNSGWPMAALALALGVRLSKPGHYTLNAAGRDPTSADLARADRLVSKAAVALVAIALLAILVVAIVGLTTAAFTPSTASTAPTAAVASVGSTFPPAVADASRYPAVSRYPSHA